MFGRVAARNIAVLLGILLAVCGAPAGAAAQWQSDLSAIAPTEPPSAPPAEPFGLAAMPVANGELLAKWNGVVADIRAENEILARCRDLEAACPPAAQKFLHVIADGRARMGRARIGVINRAINLAIKPTSDLAQWGVEDRWSAPLATLTTGRGDCEDYAIAKYVALIEAGISDEDVKLVIVRNLAAGDDHAVVAVRLDDAWIVLDNRRLALLKDVEMPQVMPLFALDRDGVKQFAATALADASRTAAPGAAAAAAPGSLEF